ncbi:hypothetical protein P8935_14295 [Telmatobacter sp. DSM 110680]|uniref:Exostosin GT47 domain-containing protein n=1 Tax=Telmatobacter sp. DSM 110680 TaxID=3036704 RepID=A0AAU7DEG6_9BACT
MNQPHSAASAVSSVHRYFSWRSSAEGPPVEFPNGAVWDDRLVPEWRYPLSVLSHVQREMPATALRFYFTKNPYELPEYGNDVVAVLWQEERSKIPTYARHVRGVIHCCLQMKPFLGFHPRLGLNKYEAVLTFQYLRDWALHLRSRYGVRHVPKGWPPALHDSPRVLAIPLGYHSQEELPQIPMAERRLDAFFTGQLSTPLPRTSYRYWTTDSKTQARKQLWDVLLRLRKDTEWRIETADIAGGETKGQCPEFHAYSSKMMNSRICLAPRGTMAETFRHYEGWRAGCLVITNILPPEPFLAGAPAIQVENWRELPQLLKKYARDLDALEHYRMSSLKFWQTRLSESVIGVQVAQFLRV